jgi:hypothetical protein
MIQKTSGADFQGYGMGRVRADGTHNMEHGFQNWMDVGIH